MALHFSILLDTTYTLLFELKLMVLKTSIMDKNDNERISWWEFANSRFGFWVISVLIVGGAYFFYEKINEAKNKKKEREERIVKLDKEIANRIRQLTSKIDRELDSLNLFNSGLQQPDFEKIKSVYFEFKLDPSNTSRNYKELYQEFGDTNIITLMNELIELDIPNDDIHKVQAIIDQIRTNQNLPIENDIGALLSFVNKFKLERWKPYMRGY